jgi:hypothetical protein
MYLYFSETTPEKIQESQMEHGGMLRSVEYRRVVTAEERLIQEWGGLLFNRVGQDLLRVVYASRI